MIRQAFWKNCASLILYSLGGALLISCSAGKDKATDPVVAVFDQPDGSGLGFAKAENIRNQNMQNARLALLKLAIPSGPKVLWNAALGNVYGTPSAAYGGIKSLGPRATETDRVIALQLANCIAKPAETCLVQTHFVQMSAFLINNGTQIATSFTLINKILQNSYTADEIANMGLATLKTLNLDFIAFNSGDQAVIDESSRAHLLSVSSVGSDGVAILRLQNALSYYLSAAQQELKVGETAYVAGYPLATTDRVGVGAKDSDGSGVLFSHGFNASIATVYGALGKDWEGLSGDNKVLLNTTTLALRIDATDEMLGGPILNEAGRFVGILTSTSVDLTKKYSFGINYSSF